MIEFPLSRLVPHDHPMILIDEILVISADCAEAAVTIHSGSPFYDPDMQVVPGWVGIEYMAQTVAAWAGYHALMKGQAIPIGFLLGCRRYDAGYSGFSLGETLRVTVERVMEDNGMGIFRCTVFSGERQVADSQITTYAPPRQPEPGIPG